MPLLHLKLKYDHLFSKQKKNHIVLTKIVNSGQSNGACNKMKYIVHEVQEMKINIQQYLFRSFSLRDEKIIKKLKRS